MKHPDMSHPSEAQLALFAGGDLGFWDRWQVSRHVARCAQCSGEVAALRSVQDDVRDVAAQLPKDLNWDRLSQEMTGNIRVGLAAGEAIARFDRPAARPMRLRWQAAMVFAGATAIFGVAFWTSVPPAQKDHLIAAFRRIPQARATVDSTDEVMIEASPTGLEVKDHGRTLSLTHPHSDGVTVSVSMRGSAGVRYVDADTGQVTTNKVYYDTQ